MDEALAVSLVSYLTSTISDGIPLVGSYTLCDNRVDRVTKKSLIGKSPFEHVYSLVVTLPLHLKLQVYQLLQNFSSDRDVFRTELTNLLS